MEANNRRTANVISIDTVNCLTLSRTDFTRLLATLKVKLLEHQAVRGASNMAGMKGASSDLLQTSSLANKRRISAFNTHGHRDDSRISNLFKRFTKFVTESLWNSLYSRMYREMILDPSKQIEYGLVAEEVIRENDQRYGAVMVSRGRRPINILHRSIGFMFPNFCFSGDRCKYTTYIRNGSSEAFSCRSCFCDGLIKAEE